MVYATGTNDRRVFALDAADGTIQWEASLDPGFQTVAPVIAGDTLYVAAAGFGVTDLYGFDRTTGDRKYKQRYGAEIASPLAVGTGDVYFLGDELTSGGEWPAHPRSR